MLGCARLFSIRGAGYVDKCRFLTGGDAEVAITISVVHSGHGAKSVAVLEDDLNYDDTQGTWTNHAARRKRKLLLNRSEIDKIERRVSEKGLTIVPTRLYFRGPRAKVELALARCHPRGGARGGAHPGGERPSRRRDTTRLGPHAAGHVLRERAPGPYCIFDVGANYVNSFGA